MIQEITPKRFWNAYETREPQADSEIICVSGENYCIIHGEGGDRFLRYEELLRETDLLGDDVGQKLQYLFALLDGDARTDYFLYVCEKEYAFSQLPQHSWEPTWYLNHKMAPRFEAFAGMTAHHLHVWYRDNRFCGRCGGGMVHDDKRKIVRDGMIAAADGYGVFSGMGFKVACKTGTAQDGNNLTANFICYAPAEDPKIAIEITLEKGGYGSNLSPFVVEILQYYFNGQVPSYAVEGLSDTATFSYNTDTTDQ